MLKLDLQQLKTLAVQARLTAGIEATEGTNSFAVRTSDESLNLGEGRTFYPVAEEGSAEAIDIAWRILECTHIPMRFAALLYLVHHLSEGEALQAVERFTEKIN